MTDGNVLKFVSVLSFIAVLTICGTLVYLNEHPYKTELAISIYADNNTLEIMKSINWTAISPEKPRENNYSNLTAVLIP
jgi:hypothetical protein